MRIEINEYVVADTQICHGQPTFKGTRIMISIVLELLAGGVTIDEILKDYYPQLNKKAILAALSYASKTIDGERYASFEKA